MMRERERAFENRFAHDEELKFRITARRNRLTGLWAAEKLGLSSDDATLYAQDVVSAALQKNGNERLFQKIRSDFDAGRIEQSDHRIRRRMDEDMLEAQRQVLTE
ncbi:hypothetical protein GCM10011390_07180 [Aureimonas endophytica]|uniref:DUF1476 domain-containing protein n=1 Tax=Aureimonas endophytica TaxID=2027858 RepID=A0A916ZDZ3_9HYPH|nr:DUF1476 domain-containing protein [Aureimonas endophytica]GGD91046.1 hypothetical protein GCM10011390_07180 [Aureimonas endophytica]